LQSTPEPTITPTVAPSQVPPLSPENQIPQSQDTPDITATLEATPEEVKAAQPQTRPLTMPNGDTLHIPLNATKEQIDQYINENYKPPTTPAVAPPKARLPSANAQGSPEQRRYAEILSTNRKLTPEEEQIKQTLLHQRYGTGNQEAFGLGFVPSLLSSAITAPTTALWPLAKHMLTSPAVTGTAGAVAGAKGAEAVGLPEWAQVLSSMGMGYLMGGGPYPGKGRIGPAIAAGAREGLATPADPFIPKNLPQLGRQVVTRGLGGMIGHHYGGGIPGLIGEESMRILAPKIGGFFRGFGQEWGRPTPAYGNLGQRPPAAWQGNVGSQRGPIITPPPPPANPYARTIFPEPQMKAPERRPIWQVNPPAGAAATSAQTPPPPPPPPEPLSVVDQIAEAMGGRNVKGVVARLTNRKGELGVGQSIRTAARKMFNLEKDPTTLQIRQGVAKGVHISDNPGVNPQDLEVTIDEKGNANVMRR
jgi:hypothetical protein